MRTCVLSIAGYDPSGGAGVLADIKTFEQLECTGIAVVTAMTLQNSHRIDRIDWRNEQDIESELDLLAEEFVPRAIKIGVIRDLMMLKRILRKCNDLWSGAPVIWDPVMKASSGASFGLDKSDGLDPTDLNGINYITPNDSEFQRLFSDQSYDAVILRKGEINGEKVVDTVINGTDQLKYEYDRDGYEVHGSGCVFSSALAAKLAQGRSIHEAYGSAHSYTMKYRSSSNDLVGYHT